MCVCVCVCHFLSVYFFSTERRLGLLCSSGEVSPTAFLALFLFHGSQRVCVADKVGPEFGVVEGGNVPLLTMAAYFPYSP